MSKFFSTKIFVIRRYDGTKKILRNKQDAVEYCDEEGIDFSTCVDTFDSKKEYSRYTELVKMQESGKISDLRRQVPYVIIPAHYENRFICKKAVKSYMVNGLIFDFRKEAVEYCKEKSLPQSAITKTEVISDIYKDVCVEQEAIYTADFTYRVAGGELVVEDVKSAYTKKEPDYVLRRKLMLHVHGIKISEYE